MQVIIELLQFKITKSLRFGICRTYSVPQYIQTFFFFKITMQTFTFESTATNSMQKTIISKRSITTLIITLSWISLVFNHSMKDNNDYNYNFHKISLNNFDIQFDVNVIYKLHQIISSNSIIKK